MSLIISEVSKSFEVLEPGVYRAVCADIVDLGIQETPYGDKDQIRIHWLVDSIISSGKYEGKPFGMVKRYTKSLNKKSSLRKDLEKWRGRSFTEEELKGFDLENLIGKSCQLAIIPGDKDPEIQRWIDSVLPDVKNAEALKIPSDYKRSKDRPENEDPYGNIKNQKPGDLKPVDQKPSIEEEDVPF